MGTETPITSRNRIFSSTASSAVSLGATRRKFWCPSSSGGWLPQVILAPSALAITTFVYVFILVTLWISLSKWTSLKVDLGFREPALETYRQMFAMDRWHADLRNVFVFTVLFLFLALGIGLLLAVLLDRRLIGHQFFRNVFLFPYALSFIVTGIAWRWIFNPEAGVNVLFQLLGVNQALAVAGIGPLKPGWVTDPTVLFPVNDLLGKMFPAANDMATLFGIPVALIPVLIAACWQLTGFAMAMYIAGLCAIPAELREAARIDGASEIQLYRHVIVPQLKPITVSLAIILGHMSLKIFDLVFAMTGPGPGFATDMPGIFVFEQTFRAVRYNLGAAASVFMLLLVAAIIVPYLRHNLRGHR
ncbi:MAG: sugar ABC transporter permease [Verrucomicrobia bacterium]|nr:sugar ABC transporter permease [Verrucomicrobiota bacterium]